MKFIWIFLFCDGHTLAPIFLMLYPEDTCGNYLLRTASDVKGWDDLVDGQIVNEIMWQKI